MTGWKQLVEKKATKALWKRSTPLPIKEVAWRALRFVMKCGKSNPISFAVRPIIMHKKLRTVVGINLVILVLLAAAFGTVPSFAGDNTGGNLTTLGIAGTGDVSLATKEAVRIPLKNYSVSQGFWLFHTGIDMASSIGELVFPVMKGKVIKVEFSKFGYGNNVIISHGVEYVTLYGHLSAIDVKEGQEVTTETIIGKVGSTGRSTGPHLHLEIHEDGKPINPAPILGI